MGTFVLPIVPTLVTMVSLSSCGLVSDTTDPRGGAMMVHELSMEITALATLQRLDFNTRQLEMLGKIAKETGQPAGVRQAIKCSTEFRQVLVDLRAALEKPDDTERIGNLQNRLEELRDSENPDIDD